MSKRTDWTIKQAAMWVATHNATGETLVARSREALPGETRPLDLLWVIRFEFDNPVSARPGTAWELLDGDNDIYSAVLLHQSNIASQHNAQFALEGTSDQNGCQYTYKKTVWYSAKFEFTR